MRQQGKLFYLFAFIAAGCTAPKQYTAIPNAVPSAEAAQKTAIIKQITKNSFDFADFTDSNGTKICFRMLVPPGIYAGTTRRYPMIVVFHGSGAIGTDNESQLGMLSKFWATEENQTKYPCYVLVPQFAARSANYDMDPQRHMLTSHGEAPLTAALQLADRLKRYFPVDTSRIYAVGFSMGASTALNALARRPDLFAAGIAISGIPNFSAQQTLADIPLWMVHGNADTENTFAGDSLFYKEMMLRGAKKLRFWEMDKGIHEIPYQLYTTDEMPKWLFCYRKHFK